MRVRSLLLSLLKSASSASWHIEDMRIYDITESEPD
jgi:hypothetical protein